MSNRLLRLFSLGALALVLLFGLSANPALAQSTAFTYQGKLADSGNPANGNYDFQFKLFDTQAVGTGTQFGSPLVLANVAVTYGSFSVQLDFGSCATCFNGSVRYLEVSVKPISSQTFTVLGPRQLISTTPYALRSQNAASATAADGLSVACVNCVTSSQIQSVSGSSISGTIPISSVPAGSANYIQNGTSQQATTNFNISGDGMAGGTLTGSIVNAATQYRINGLRAFTVNGAYDNGSGGTFTASNTFIGDGAGLNTAPSPIVGNVTGKLNTFYGAGAGQANTTGSSNAYFGNWAGRANTTGTQNAFFGSEAGFNNTTGGGNTYNGFYAGARNTTGQENTYLGFDAGDNDLAGSANTFVGKGTGFVGGNGNTTGNNNTLLGTGSSVDANLTNATAIGAAARVTQSNSIVLGSINSVSGAPDTSVGIGTTAPAARLHVVGNWNGAHGALTLQGDKPTIRFSGGAVAGNQQWMLHLGSDGPGSLEFFNGGTTGAWGPVLTMTPAGAVGIGTTTPTDALQVVGNLRVGFGTNGCVKDADGTVIAGTCSSDIRLKRDILPFTHLLDRVAQLQPVTFYWRSEEFKDRHFGTRQSYGLIAQQVEKVLPELVTEDEQGYKAVNYSKLPLLSIQAIKELKAENDSLKEQIKEQQVRADRQQRRLQQQQQQLTEQQQQMDAMKQALCQLQPQADFCKLKTAK